jgi:hypothetical protein
MTQTLTYVVSCEGLGLAQPFVESCWGYVMFKCHQYATHDSKVSINLNIFPSRKHNLFHENLSCGPRKVGRANKNGTQHVYIMVCPKVVKVDKTHTNCIHHQVNVHLHLSL